ncbi:MAG TPA: zinc-dependent alcohol dehydrogenase [Azospirillaceae bacterium]|nr:zinc-dependent alcohol dehydrogenase [Azospirillaceae bacterium]
MKALCWNGVNDLRVENVPDPSILNPRDAIVEVTLSSVCGSDLHLIDGYVPTMQPGDIIGHEFMGTVVDTGSEVRRLKKGDRVVVISIIGCGECWHCKQQEYSLCDNSNHQPQAEELLFGQCTAAIFGYSHAFGGYAGSHAQYIRVPFADQGACKVPDGVRDEQAVFVSDAAPTGFMAAEMAAIQPGDVVAVWGAGGVGQMAMRIAWLMGAERVIAIDRLPDRLSLARTGSKAETLDYTQVNVYDALLEMTGGRGPDRCIDAVGMEAYAPTADYWYDRAKQMAKLSLDRVSVLRQMVQCCRKGGTISIVGVYAGLIDKFPMGAAMNKALTFRMGQQHGQKFAPQLFEWIREGRLETADILTHRMSLDAGAEGYRMFKEKRNDCMRVVFAPH